MAPAPTTIDLADADPNASWRAVASNTLTYFDVVTTLPTCPCPLPSVEEDEVVVGLLVPSGGARSEEGVSCLSIVTSWWRVASGAHDHAAMPMTPAPTKTRGTGLTVIPRESWEHGCSRACAVTHIRAGGAVAGLLEVEAGVVGRLSKAGGEGLCPLSLSSVSASSRRRLCDLPRACGCVVQSDRTAWWGME